MRKLAEVVTINEIGDIPGADFICKYRVKDGWWVVDKKGAYQVGDKVVYCQIDSWIPNYLASFLSNGKEPREYNGVKGERLRTIKLKGQISQGLILPLTLQNQSIEIGTDLTDILGIQKWEPPIDFIGGDAKGNFPSYVPRTDQDRIQGCFSDINFIDTLWEISEKLDGCSGSYIYHKGEFSVCSRNLSLSGTKFLAFSFEDAPIGDKIL